MQTVRLLAGNAITSFFKAHLVLLALAASAGWFYAGNRYFAKGNPKLTQTQSDGLIQLRNSG
jgi:hypothetical protein